MNVFVVTVLYLIVPVFFLAVSPDVFCATVPAGTVSVPAVWNTAQVSEWFSVGTGFPRGSP